MLLFVFSSSSSLLEKIYTYKFRCRDGWFHLKNLCLIDAVRAEPDDFTTKRDRLQENLQKLLEIVLKCYFTYLKFVSEATSTCQAQFCNASIKGTLPMLQSHLKRFEHGIRYYNAVQLLKALFFVLASYGTWVLKRCVGISVVLYAHFIPLGLFQRALMCTSCYSRFFWSQYLEKCYDAVLNFALNFAIRSPYLLR